MAKNKPAGRSRILAIPDLHCPADHRRALPWVRELLKEIQPTQVVLLGDIADHNAISFHDKLPELPAAKEEYRQMRRRIRMWHNLIPEAWVCIGNHDERVQRVVRKMGIPASIYLKEYNEVFDTPGWKWQYSVTIDDVLYTHGHGRSSAWTIARNTNKSTVCGHLHTKAEIQWMATDHTKFFGMNCGCLVDRHHPAMEYAKSDIVKPLLGCGIIIDGQPQLRMMDL